MIDQPSVNMFTVDLHHSRIYAWQLSLICGPQSDHMMQVSSLVLLPPCYHHNKMEMGKSTVSHFGPQWREKTEYKWVNLWILEEILWFFSTDRLLLSMDFTIPSDLSWVYCISYPVKGDLATLTDHLNLLLAPPLPEGPATHGMLKTSCRWIFSAGRNVFEPSLKSPLTTAWLRKHANHISVAAVL